LFTLILSQIGLEEENYVFSQEAFILLLY
jgi:hypothetical protein